MFGDQLPAGRDPGASPGSRLARSAPACGAGSPPWSRGRPPGAPESRLGRCPRPAGPRSSCQGPQPPPPRPTAVRGPRATSRPASAQQGQCRLSRWPSRPLNRLHRLSSLHSRGPRGRAVAAQRCSATPPFFRPKGPFWPHRPFLHAAVLQHFRHRGGKAAAIPNKTQELVCDSSGCIPPVLKLSSRSFLGRSCPMFEPFLPREEDGLKAAGWGLFVIRALLGFKGGDGACAGLSSHRSEEFLMFTGYA